jgi:hypothetical protein
MNEHFSPLKSLETGSSGPQVISVRRVQSGALVTQIVR